MKFYWIAIPLFLSVSAFAEPFHSKCPDIPACAKYVGELLGQKYLYDKDVKGSVETSGNVDINRENAELLFTQMLWTNGFTRVPVNAENTFTIMRQRDARDAAIPVFKADENTEPRMPNTWDIVTLVYTASHPELLEGMARELRSFMPAASRIIPSGISGQLLITDSIPNMKKVLQLVRQSDKKLTPEAKKALEKLEARHEEERRFRAMHMEGGERMGAPRQPGKPQEHPDPQ